MKACQLLQAFVAFSVQTERPTRRLSLRLRLRLPARRPRIANQCTQPACAVACRRSASSPTLPFPAGEAT